MQMSGGQTMPTGSRPDPEVWTTHQEFKDYEFPIAQRAAMLWYHDHRMDFTGPQVWRGLAGAFIIRDEQEEQLGLPSGEKELVLVICDRAFAKNGDFLYPSLDTTLINRAGIKDDYMEGALGDVILVNGAPWPVAKVATTRYRLRFLNASNARRYNLQLHANRGKERLPFVQIGSDGGLLAAPQQLDAIPLASAERFDVIVDFSQYPVGTELVLSNSLDQGTSGQVMKFVVDRVETDKSQPLPTRLVVQLSTIRARTVPLPQVVTDVLALHLARFPAAAGLVFHELDGQTAAPGPRWACISPSRRRGPGTGRHTAARPEALLRQPVDPSRGSREGHPGPAGPRRREGDARHLRAHVARLGGPHQDGS